ncbi:DUF4180 domain-containing protein [Paenibacillus sp. OAS669]|uniref:DUF4180 domain-containing protein n=1 Tax=Paenibacillus sp. OAS669 TaxID=2663821 RepID=UPI001789AB7A|nr:DUF4180 domain-containing protein [Paenibacillus sp. OAS669]MBE1443760.1 hypothetical protein [Paenibacillus sp. OAS669]
MNIVIDQRGDSKVAVIESSDIVIGDVQDALDLMATVNYTEECHKILLNKANITEDFFELRTKLAGEILQKYTNYQVKLAVVGDFEGYNSKSLRDFIYECNHGKQFFFVKDNEAGLEALHSVR